MSVVSTSPQSTSPPSRPWWLARSTELPRPRADLLVALVLFLGSAWLLTADLTGPGIGRDEGMYMTAGETYWHWLEGAKSWKQRLRKEWIDRHFGYNWEHPPFAKWLFGLGWRLFHRCRCPEQRGLHRVGYRTIQYRQRHGTLGLLGEIAAFRLPSALLVALAVAAAYLLGASTLGRLAGLVGALLFLFMPRVFFHARIAGLDGPITATILLAVASYWKALHRARWLPVAGVCLGAAVATKLNALFLPLLFAAHYAWASRREFGSGRRAALGLGLLLPGLLLSAYFAATLRRPALALPAAAALVGLLALRGLRTHPGRTLALSVPAVFWAQLLLGAALLFGLWPSLWVDPWPRLWRYLSFHLHHVYYNTEYFGRNYNLPPFPVSFPFFMTLATVPAVTCLLAGAGLGLSAARWVRQPMGPQDPEGARSSFWVPLAGRPRSGLFLIGLFALFPILLIALPTTPIFGGTRTWLPAMPFLALLAGYAFQELLAQATHAWRPRRRALLAPLAGACLLAAPVVETRVAGDLAPSYYAPIVGGVRGGADIGLKRQYWGYASRPLLPTLNRLLPHGGNVYWHDTIWYARDLYVRDRLLRQDIRFSGTEYWGVARSQVALFLYEKHQVKWEFLIWQLYGTFKPRKVLTFQEVPLVTLYGPRRRSRGLQGPTFMDRPGR